MSALYVLKEGQKWGPFTADEIKGHVAAGSFVLQDLAWREGLDDWEPLHQLIEEEDEQVQHDAVLFEGDNVMVTADYVQLEEKHIPLHSIAKASIQIEHVRRLKPLIASIIIGVIVLCVALLEFPRQTTTHWIIWGTAVAVLFVWWLRVLFVGLRTPSSLIVLDLADGNERLLQVKPNVAKRFDEAIQEALKQARARHH